ncbi:SAM hydrolase/SAM-dependent halogenase family protein [Planktothrix agardhii]|uniref:SAM hydrolase/SAM-dependent halogenase family protein n=1 Tax=Planktothrix agardhii TaxID=1160 RepID=UPI0004138E0C|nr:SAM-dependent chlorinase/fluorinase [Planktothrix agardhii]
MKQDHKIITLLTDFGLKDIYVAVMKGVIYQINPKINIIDLTHDIPPQNIAAGRFNLLNAYPYFPEKTVHIAVVDPEVGTKRRAIAIQFNNNYLVGPDNGLLTGILEPFLTCEMEAINRNNNMEAINCNNNMEAINRNNNMEAINRNNNMEAINRNNVIAVELNYPEYWRTAKPSTTFHGRDIFASVGAHLASGVPLEKLGTIIDHKTLVRLSLPPCQVHDLKIQGCIQYIDGFGNLVTNIPGEIVANKYWYVAISKEKNNKRKKSRKNKHKKSKKNLNSQQQILSGSSYLIGAGQTYGDVPLGHFVALVGSHGWVEIALNGGNAQQKLKVDWGTRVQTLFY